MTRMKLTLVIKLSRGYKDNDEATRESMLAPGWYRTGDVGYLDENGYLIIVDRIKDVIKYKGYSQNAPKFLIEPLKENTNLVLIK